jgi:hypothetical protein
VAEYLQVFRHAGFLLRSIRRAAQSHRARLVTNPVEMGRRIRAVRLGEGSSLSSCRGQVVTLASGAQGSP